MNLPDIVSRDEWLAARKALLLREKEMTRARDALNAERRRLPMVRIEKKYVFEGVGGKADLRDLFEGRRQLIVYHMMWVKCPGCSLLVDNIGPVAHLHARDTTLVVVSRSPWPELNAFKQRMGWTLPFFSSAGSDFNYDFHVTLDSRVAPVEYNYRSEAELRQRGEDVEGEAHGVSVFLRDGNSIYHTYSTYARGIDLLSAAYNLLDMVPRGRDEGDEGPSWVRRHDEY